MKQINWGFYLFLFIGGQISAVIMWAVTLFFDGVPMGLLGSMLFFLCGSVVLAIMYALSGDGNGYTESE